MKGKKANSQKKVMSFRRNVEDIIWKMDLEKIQDMNVGKIINDKTREINRLHGTEMKENNKLLKNKLEKDLKKLQKEDIFSKKLNTNTELKFNQLSQEVYMELRQKCKMFEGKNKEKDDKVFRSYQDVSLATDYNQLFSQIVRDKIKFFDYKVLLQSFIKLRNKLLFQKIKNNSKEFDFEECQLMQKISMEDIALDERQLIMETLCQESDINLGELLEIKKEDMQPFLRDKGDMKAAHQKIINTQLDKEQLDKLMAQDDCTQNQNLIKIYMQNQMEEMGNNHKESNLLAMKKKESRNRLYDSLNENYKHQVQQTINDKRSVDNYRFFKKILKDQFTANRTSDDFLTTNKASYNKFANNTNSFTHKIHKDDILTSLKQDSHYCPRFNNNSQISQLQSHLQNSIQKQSNKHLKTTTSSVSRICTQMNSQHIVKPLYNQTPASVIVHKKTQTTKQLQLQKQQQKKQFRHLFSQFNDSQQTFTTSQLTQSQNVNKLINNLEQGMGILKFNTQAIQDDKQETNLQLAAIKTEKCLQRYILEFLVDTLQNKQEFYIYYQQELFQRKQQKEIEERMENNRQQ